MLQYRIALKLRVLGGHQNQDLIEDLFFSVGFPQIVKYADALDCRSGPLLDKVLWDYHINAYDFVHYEYDSYVDLTLDRLANIHLDSESGYICQVWLDGNLELLPSLPDEWPNYASDIIGVCVFVCVCVCVRVCMLPGRVDLFAPEYIESIAVGARALLLGNAPREFSQYFLKVRVFWSPRICPRSFGRVPIDTFLFSYQHIEISPQTKICFHTFYNPSPF
eukprot:sb/3469783/